MAIWRIGTVVAPLLFACSKDRIAAPNEVPPGTIQLEQGGGQLGEPNTALRRSIVVAVVDTSGAPVSGVRVTFEPQDGGSVGPVSAETGTDGRVSAHWTLGPDTTAHIVIARADGYDPISISATAALPAPPIGQLRLIELATYDGSGQSVHPDFATADDDWPAPRRYLAITPYPHSNKAYENPSFYEAYRSVRWSIPPGATNPLDSAALPRHLSDPDVVFDPDRREFFLYYREVAGENIIWLKRSADAVRWSDRVIATRGLANEILSPAVVRRSANEWLMWSVDVNVGCDAHTTEVELRRSTDGVSWSQPEATNLSREGMYAWHLDVQWIDDLGEYWAVFNRKDGPTCNTRALYLATSRDGRSWTTYPTPVLEQGVIPEFEDIVYRATFYYNPSTGVVNFWYSGARHDGVEYVWRTAVQRRLRADVIAEASRLFGPRVFRQLRIVPPLRNPP